ncbi:metastasis-associated protein MTA3-like isoform X2 [Ctenocephalides felis]|uniref:metastasis-associated protein MTA3-like isoform X2 n=1 Tax=Ctenocephalides felis TaxID=7515 RepID=UPI000E6E43F7|nr:metastasis-associated protein MTA3-like isoform X2 [Ctenocephalides felis]XP_026478134.1 metastasis-associated protein MTA3-like isoform X2 [Ctenocephalides felis]
MTSNMYRVGDYVYFESSSTSPYQIRRIEELNKTASGNVEAKVMCFYRRRDLPGSLVQLADKHQVATSEDSPVAMKLKKMWLKTPVSEEQAAQAVLDPAIAALDEDHLMNNSSSNVGGGGSERVSENALLTPKQRLRAKHRELFLSRQVETLPATHIRGKCSVTLLNETEALTSYLNKEDAFFYCLVFDPTQKTLLADKGEIRVGSRYQTEIIPLLQPGEKDPRDSEVTEQLVWTPRHQLTDRQIDQFLVVSRSVGTFARALDCSSSVKQPSLHMSAAAASRDITLFHAMDTLHQHQYRLDAAIGSLVPSSGPVLCRDEMEEWSASEANLFEEALEKYGKDFNDIRTDFLPWKTLKNIIEYYYMWKTTDRYVQQKRVKAVEAESKLKQVYIPNYSNGSTDPVAPSGKNCESCGVTSSPQWYQWGPGHMQCRLCNSCWQYWKKYGGLKNPARILENEQDIANAVKKRTDLELTVLSGTGDITDIQDAERLLQNSGQLGSGGVATGVGGATHRPHRCTVAGCGKEFKLRAHLARHYATVHCVAMRSGSPRPVMKTRTAFYLHATAITRASRILCRHLVKARHAARAPFYPINAAAVKQECALAMAGRTLPELKQLLVYRKKDRGSVTQIANRLGNPGTTVADWLILTLKENMPKPEKVSFPKPPIAADGSLMYERVPNKSDLIEKTPINCVVPPTTVKRRFDEVNGLEPAAVAAPPAKRPNKDPMPQHRPSPEQYAAMLAAAQATGQPLPRHIHHPKIAQLSRSGSGRKQVISWMDAPDDVYFRATETSKRARRSLSSTELRRAARKPWRNLPIRPMTDTQLVILD